MIQHVHRHRRGSGHAWRPMARRFHWPVCRRCGLVFLKNRVSELAARGPCDADSDPEEN